MRSTIEMVETRRHHAALAVWEDEGGRVTSLLVGAVARSREQLDRRERAVRLNGDLTYLGLTWLNVGAAHARIPDMSHVEGRSLWRACLTSERFSFLVRMRGGLRALLHLGEVGPEPR